jgi:membrane associated rhomboid family serine protease
MYFFYYIPVGIDAETRRFALFTYLFALLCVVVFVVNRFFSGDLPLDFRGYIYFPGRSGWGAAAAAAFLHFDYFHLLSNLLYLVLFGRYLEDRLGSPMFAALFLGAAIAGNLAQGWHNLHVLGTHAGIIGASGAVSGLMGAVLVRLRHHRVKIAYWIFAPLMATNRAGTAQLHVVFAFALWILIQVVRGLVQLEGAGANVAYVTHIAGFAFGLLATIATGGWQRGRVDGHLVKAKRYLRRGEFFGAQDELSHYARARPWDGEAHAALARASMACGDREGARASYRAACECHLASGRRGAAESIYQEAARAYGHFFLAADAHLDLCFGLERSLKPAAALTAYESFVRAYHGHDDAPFALLRAANLQAKQGSAERARLLYEQLVARYPGSEWVDFATEHARRLAAS